MNSFVKTFYFSLIASVLCATCCYSSTAGNVRKANLQHSERAKHTLQMQPLQIAPNVRAIQMPHPQRAKNTFQKHTLQKAVKQQIHKYKPQSLKTSSKSVTHNSKIVFNKQLESSPGIYFMDDMENGINGWTIDTHQDTLWHLTEDGYPSPTHSWWCGIDSTGRYSTGSRVDQSLISPAIDLGGATFPIHLLFNEFINTEYMKDLCMVGVSTDGGATWTEMRTDSSTSSGAIDRWVLTDFDLSGYAGQIINIRFHFFTTDELNNEYPGWYIDNVIVSTSGTISGVQYFDVNQNGIRDNSERPMSSGMTMTATSSLFSFYTSTNYQGVYSFTLPAGTYTITEDLVLLEGWTPTSPSSGSVQITLDPTQIADDTANFGNWHPYATVSGYVFNDANYNGIQDSSETLVPDQQIGINGPGLQQYERTNSSGYFSFAVTDTGNYAIWEDLPDTIIQTLPPNYGANVISVHDLSANITDVRFGNYYVPPYGRTCAIGGWLFKDLNKNGVKDVDESGIGGIEVGLWGDDNQTTFSDSTGHYMFDNLYPGFYEVNPTSTSTPYDWFLFSPPLQYYDIDLLGGIKIDTANFGYRPPSLIFSGYVFNDADYNGIRDSSETLVPNREIEIDGPNGYYRDRFTDSSGHFSIGAIDTGRYYIWEDFRDTVFQTFPPYDGVYVIDVHDFSTNFTDLKFGNYFLPPWGKTCAIGGWLFSDLNKNGVRDLDEPGLAGIEVDLSGDHNRTIFSDSTGHYMFDSLYPGDYEVAPTSYWWYFPSLYYDFSIPGGMKIDTANFAGYLSVRSASIGGWLFYDWNRSGQRDGDEPGIAGISVHLSGEDDRITYSDSVGHYMFDSLFPGHYQIYAGRTSGWIVTSPVDGYYDFDLGEGDRAVANFGEMPLNGASISGQCFNDVDRDGGRDPAEYGNGGWTITLSGKDCQGNNFQRQVTTDISGNYFIDSLCKGTYSLKQTPRSRWVQTLPPDFRPIVLSLVTGEHHPSADFGNAFDSTFNIGYRSFTSDSIALAKSYDGKKYGQPIKKFLVSQAFFTMGLQDFVSSGYTTTVTGLQITFKYAFIDSLVVEPAATQTYDNTRKSVVLSFPDGLSYGDSVQIQGVCANPKPSTSFKQSLGHAYWTFTGGSKSVKATYLISTPYRYLKPNAVDMLMATMNGHSIQIGLTRDKYSSHTVLIKKYGDVVKSLVDSRGNMHAGSPTCLGTYTGGGSIKRVVSSLPPSKQNNILFAEATALKVNLLASQYNITPFGFGDLIFDERGENPLNGKSIYFIADLLDQYMSSYRDASGEDHCQIPVGYEWLDPQSFYQTIRKINSAFCGPIDYLDWTPGSTNLVLTAVRPVMEIPYLHIDSSFSTIGKRTAIKNVAIYEPERFNLKQNYPNPFNPTTTISFTLPQESYVTLKIYNTLGHEVAMLTNREQMGEGPQEIEFNASNLSSGVYFYHIKAEGIADEENGIAGQTFIAVKKMVLLK